jgi:hypothetical protein
MIRTMPTSVYEGHLDAFLDAAKAGASASDLRLAIGHFWGKLMIHSLANRQWQVMRVWGSRILAEPTLGVSPANLAAASILALPRAVASWWRRRHHGSVYFL